jgi:hypothetical protein
MNVYRYVCHKCCHWWSTTIIADHCPECNYPEPGRVHLESEESAMLAALGALTFERDEALKKLENARRYFAINEDRVWQVVVEWDGDMPDPSPELVYVRRERDEARRWAAHFYRLWKATPKPPFYPAIDAAMEQAAEETAARVTGRTTGKRSKGGKK